MQRKQLFVVKLRKIEDNGSYTVGTFDTQADAEASVRELNKKSRKGQYEWELATHNPSVEQMASMH